MATGVIAAAAGNRLLATIVYVPSMPEPLLLAGACAVLAVTAAIAAVLPARRAVSIDPMQALRAE